MLSFSEFQATGRNVADLSTIPHCAAQELYGAGRVYLDDEWPLVIESGSAPGLWCLTIGNDSHESNDLQSLERKLYQFAVSEGYVTE